MVFIWNRLVILKLIWLSLLLPRVCKFWSDHIFLRAVLTHSMHDCLRMIPVFKGTKLTLFPCSSYLSSAANVRHYQLILHALFGFHQNVAALLCSSLCIKVLRGFVLLFVWCWLVEAGWLLTVTCAVLTVICAVLTGGRAASPELSLTGLCVWPFLDTGNKQPKKGLFQFSGIYRGHISSYRKLWRRMVSTWLWPQRLLRPGLELTC